MLMESNKKIATIISYIIWKMCIYRYYYYYYIFIRVGVNTSVFCICNRFLWNITNTYIYICNIPVQNLMLHLLMCFVLPRISKNTQPIVMEMSFHIKGADLCCCCFFLIYRENWHTCHFSRVKSHIFGVF